MIIKQLVAMILFFMLGFNWATAAELNLVSADLDRVIVCNVIADSDNQGLKHVSNPTNLSNSTEVIATEPDVTDSAGVNTRISKHSAIRPPSFSGPGCNVQSAWEIDPQNTSLWAKFSLDIPASMLNDKKPLSVYVSGKTSSSVYFNGVYLGQNGTPSLLASEEFPGKIDAMFYVSPSLLKPENNQIVIQFSSHHGFLQLENPIHFIGFGSYSSTNSILQQSLGVSIVPLGALVLGALYFLVASFGPFNRRTNILFLLMCSLAASQLLAEISRMLFSYSYPLHDLRLMVISSLSLAFGMCLLYFICLKLALKNSRFWIILGGVVSLVAVYYVPGFDTKTALGIFVPSCFCTVLIAQKLFHKPSKELFISLLIFLGLIITVIVTLNRFHDILFYYIITAVLAFLFIQQALTLNREQKQRRVEQQQIAKLKFKLEQNQQKEKPQKISVNSSGRVELIDSEEIAYCKAAGDYVELYLQGNKEILFSGNLKELETQLPTTFLRVHRSYLVNVDYIQSLNTKSMKRGKSAVGGGFLILKGDYEVPVSRRIMPQVRSSIL